MAAAVIKNSGIKKVVKLGEAPAAQQLKKNGMNY